MFVTGTYARPLQGISQQPQETRKEGQCSWQLNMQNNVVLGMSKRMGSHLVSNLSSHSVAYDVDSAIHYYNRGDTEQYWIIINRNANVVVLNANGQPVPVQYQDGSQAYITSESPKRDVRFQTIGDNTFILNKQYIPKWSDIREPKLQNIGIVPVLFADYGTKYKVMADGIVIGSYETPLGDKPEHKQNVDTTFVAQQIASQIGTIAHVNEYNVNFVYDHRRVHADDCIREIKLIGWDTANKPPVYCTVTLPDVGYAQNFNLVSIEGNTCYFLKEFFNNRNPPNYNNVQLNGTLVYSAAGAGRKYTAYTIQNTIIITKGDRTAFSLTTSDGRSGNDMPAIFHAVDVVGKLPRYAPIGYKVQITGKGQQKESMYWLTSRAATSGGSSTGNIIWEESRAPDTLYQLNSSSMPHSLNRYFDANGNPFFKLELVQWDERNVGDDLSNPAPSFIQDGAPINAVGVFQNRLFALAGESFVASQSNHFFNFFKETIQVAKDDAPIDKYADTAEVNTLQNFAILDGDLLLVSDGSQFIIKGDKAYTPENFNMRLATQYKNNSSIKPATTGENIVFTYNVGSYVQVREFFTDSYTDTKKARPTTEHVDQLIKGKVRRITGSTNINSVLVLTDDDLSKMYVYDYLWQDQDKVQSAWWVYQLRSIDQILHAVFDRNILMMLTRREGLGMFLESIDLGDPNQYGLSFPLRLDARVVLKANKLSAYEWVLENANVYAGLSEIECIRGEGCHADEIGNTVVFHKQPDGRFIATQADLSDANTVSVITGIKYTAEYEPTMPVIKDEKGLALSLDRLTVNTMYVNYQETGAFNCEVTNRWGAQQMYYYNGRVMGRYGNKVGFALPADGQFPVPIRDVSLNCKLKIITDSYLPFTLRNLEWKGQLTTRGRRV